MKKYLVIVVLSGLMFCLKVNSGGNAAPEFPVKYLPLGGAASLTEAEISGMAWYKDWLVLLVQYPDRFQENLFFIDRHFIRKALSQSEPDTIYPQKISVKGLKELEMMPDYQGLEAICFHGDTVYITIEMNTGRGCYAYLVSGMVSPSDTTIRVDGINRKKISPQSDLRNFSEEAILFWQGNIYTFYEANGKSRTHAHRFDIHLEEQPRVPMPHLDYRLTDATVADSTGRFWVINYFWPGDRRKFGSVDDPLFKKYGIGNSHMGNKAVERLVELEFTEERIRLCARPPLQLLLDNNQNSRNWEGIARWGNDGLLIVTDEHPGTIFGYVSFD